MSKTREIKDKININPFYSLHYQVHNIARLNHFDSLNFSLRNKTILELGAGIGDHTYYLLCRGAKVLPTEGRPELIKILNERYGLTAIELDLEQQLAKLNDIGYFDFVYCYGVLYHVNNPEEVIEKISKVGDTLFLETAVSPEFYDYGPNLEIEVSANATQALSGLGCRPNRRWLYDTLKLYYKYVYFTLTVPNNVEFPTNWNKIEINSYMNNKNPNLIRTILIASQKPIQNGNLTEDFVNEYKV